MDYKLLFHNPEDLSDIELKHMRSKIHLQRMMPYYTAGIFGLASYLFDSVLMKRAYTWTRIGVLGAVGFAIGAHASYQVQTTFPRDRVVDRDIINAFDRRYMNTVLNATGFGSNYVSSKDYAETTSLKKPY
jgi:hypothetical protein